MAFLIRQSTRIARVGSLVSTQIPRATLSSGVKLNRLILPNQPLVVVPTGRLLNRRFFATDIDEDDDVVEVEEDNVSDIEDNWMDRRTEDPKDRTRIIPLETSLAYMDSAAYKSAYGDKKIWELYRRNFKKGLTFKPTRKTCIRQGKITTGNPCPICRDEYLVVDYRNLKLINQFLSDYNGEILSSQRTGVCQKQYSKLLLEIERAKDHGLLKVDPPFVEYDYKFYLPKDVC